MADMIKRKDGSYSKRGLWDNIRANKGSGKKPTAEMLKQEKKIKNENKMGGMKKMYGGTKKKMMQKGGAKPDYLDMDKDGNKTESMKSAVASKKKMQTGGTVKNKVDRVLDTKLKDVPRKVKNTVKKGVKKVKKTISNITVGDVISPVGNAVRKSVQNKKAAKKKMGGSKMMKYQAGGFLEPPVYDLDA